MMEEPTPTADPVAAPEAPACPTCSPKHVEPAFVIGAITPRFPSLAVQREYEFERAALESGHTERENIAAVLKRRPALARMACWTMSVRNVETYHLTPRTDAELQALIEAVTPDEKSQPDTHVVVGWVTEPQECGGLRLPVLMVETIYFFNFNAFAKVMSKAVEVDSKSTADFVGRMSEIFAAIVNTSGNVGLGNARALNWAALRFAPLYHLTYEAAAKKDQILKSVDVRPSGMSTAQRPIADVVVSFQPRKMGPIEHHRVSIDLSDLFPYPVDAAIQQVFEI